MIAQPSQGPVSALRARMIEDMRVRGFTEKTGNDYVRNVRALAVFIGRSPDTATAEDLRRFQLHQTQTGMQPPSINSAVAALRFFFTVTLDRPDLARRLTIVREPRRLPAVLSVEEVTLLLHPAPGPKYKAALATAGACPRAGRRPDPWGAGLRVSEVVALKVGNIDSERMLLRVEHRKGRKSLPPRRRGTATPCCRRSCSRFRRRVAVAPPPPTARPMPSIRLKLPCRLPRGRQTRRRNRRSAADYPGQRIHNASRRIVKSP
jgi:integrase